MGELTGKTLAGRFELHDRIGSGGYGAVFRATQLSIDRECAVKVLSPRLVADETTVERFRVEAKTTSRLNHPNTVVLHDFGWDEHHSVLFLAMELLEGESLEETVEHNGPLSLSEAAKVADQMAGSLQEAHDAGTVHRDVKPGNAMLVERGGDDRFVKVIDFGIAKAFREDLDVQESLTRKGTIVGTPAYMAPEQVRGESVDGRADQYALAMTVYFLAVGSAPFQGGTSMEIASRHLTQEPSPLSTYCPERDIPEEVDRILGKAVSKEPGSRFDSVEAFSERLIGALDGVSSRKPPEGDGRSEDCESARGEQPETPHAPSAKSGAGGGTVAVAPSDWSRDAPDASSESDDRERVTARPRSAARPGAAEPSAEADGRDDSVLRIVLTTAAIASACLFVAVVAIVWFFGSFPEFSGKAVGDRAALGPDTSVATAASKNTADAGDGRRETAASDGGGVRDTAGRSGASADPAPETGTDRADGEDTRRSDDAAGKARRGEGVSSDGAVSSRKNVDGADRPRDDERAATPEELVVRMIPWGTLYVDGEEVGRGSRVEVRVGTGRHELSMRQNGDIVDERTLRLQPGEERQIELAAP